MEYGVWLSRFFLALIFLLNGLGVIDQARGAQELAGHGVPMSLVPLLMIGGRILQVVAGVALLLGVRERLAALALAAFLIPATLGMVLVAFVPGAAFAACPSTRPSFQTLRYEEDYSFLRDPDCRTDVWDRIKYMPLNEASDVYLSLGGDLRERYEYFHSAQW